MAFSMKLWQVLASDLQEVNREALNDEQRLENWVVKDPSILGIDVLLIGRQVTMVNGGRIDLLAIDSEANLVVLELKRDKTPREIVAQALDYASLINDLSYEQIEALAKAFTGKLLPEAFSDHYESSLPQAVNGSQSMIILASELDDSSERIVQYLSEQYGVPINVLFFTFFRSAAGEEFLGRAWMKDPEELQERTVARKQAPYRPDNPLRAAVVNNIRDEGVFRVLNPNARDPIYLLPGRWDVPENRGGNFVYLELGFGRKAVLKGRTGKGVDASWEPLRQRAINRVRELNWPNTVGDDRGTWPLYCRVEGPDVSLDVIDAEATREEASKVVSWLNEERSDPGFTRMLEIFAEELRKYPDDGSGSALAGE